MSVGTLFTLFVVPTAYTILARDYQADARKPGAVAVERDLKSRPHPAV
jgi:hypothetical protein